ncbi:hypothetical protein Desru_0697 [Desulforamulus ruminis DSM 2154]|uniref:Uncharacterized protein n=2 Tax=Desulforamulus ruminis TaxID=1564 RepID=F6DTW4_DESRL|nr:hypothetical protein Desru_0697 [Desulforamulus ruminis DSM 2154]
MLKLAEKLTGKGIEDCVLQYHIARGNKNDLLSKIKVREAAISHPSYREQDKVLQDMYKEMSEARAAVAIAEAALEKAKAEQTGLISLVGLLSASIQSGKETSEIEAAIAKIIDLDPGSLPKEKEEAQEGTKSQPSSHGTETQGDEMESKVFKVLETRPGKSEGTVRAYCEARDGSKHAVFAKNGNGKKLLESIDKLVFVKYRPGNKGLIAFAVEILNS